MRALKDALVSGLGRVLPAGAPVAILDVPVHRNPGDLFIYLATLRYLGDRGHAIVHRSSRRDYDRSVTARSIPSDAVLISLGGGNFGDLYPPYQALREQVVADFPHHRIVVLPQTIFFRSTGALRRCARALRAHGDLWLMVRDRASLALAQSEITPTAALAPDMAHYLWPLGPTPPSSHSSNGTLYLMRRDVERRSLPPEVPAHRSEFVDWPRFLPRGGPLALALTAGGLMVLPTGRAATRLHARWERHAEQVLQRCATGLAGYERVVTNRLHGHLLALLLGRPSDVVDNAYGKLSAYFRCWTQRVAGARLLEAVEQQPGLSGES